MKPRTNLGQVHLSQRWLWLAAACLLLLIVSCAVATPSPMADLGTSDGLPVATEFQSFYEKHGGLRVFGFPITEAYLDGDSDYLIQYFQRLRLEYDRARDRVLVTPLGQWAWPRVVAQPGITDADLLAQTSGDEFEVQGEFLKFYETHDGASLLGAAITDQLEDGDTRSQYFRNGRLDWLPEAPLGSRVQLAQLGEAHYRQVGIFNDPGRSRPMDSAGIRQADVSATLRAPILYAGEEQTVYVDVKTPGGKRPVTGVSVRLTAFYNGTSESYLLPETDGSGHTHDALALKGLWPGQKVRLVVEATSPGGTIIGTASKSFKSWW